MDDNKEGYNTRAQHVSESSPGYILYKECIYVNNNQILKKRLNFFFLETFADAKFVTTEHKYCTNVALFCKIMPNVAIMPTSALFCKIMKIGFP